LLNRSVQTFIWVRGDSYQAELIVWSVLTLLPISKNLKVFPVLPLSCSNMNLWEELMPLETENEVSNECKYCDL